MNTQLSVPGGIWCVALSLKLGTIHQPKVAVVVVLVVLVGVLVAIERIADAYVRYAWSQDRTVAPWWWKLLAWGANLALFGAILMFVSLYAAQPQVLNFISVAVIATMALGKSLAPLMMSSVVAIAFSTIAAGALEYRRDRRVAVARTEPQQPAS